MIHCFPSNIYWKYRFITQLLWINYYFMFAAIKLRYFKLLYLTFSMTNERGEHSMSTCNADYAEVAVSHNSPFRKLIRNIVMYSFNKRMSWFVRMQPRSKHKWNLNIISHWVVANICTQKDWHDLTFNWILLYFLSKRDRSMHIKRNTLVMGSNRCLGLSELGFLVLIILHSHMNRPAILHSFRRKIRYLSTKSFDQTRL